MRPHRFPFRCFMLCALLVLSFTAVAVAEDKGVPKAEISLSTLDGRFTYTAPTDIVLTASLEGAGLRESTPRSGLLLEEPGRNRNQEDNEASERVR